MDNLSPRRRSENMRLIRSQGTKPEITVRKALWGLGYRGYRLSCSGLPGKPDIVFNRRKLAIFVHGCFWHSHNCREGKRKPKSNQGYWLPKLESNKKRDMKVRGILSRSGWKVLTIWECQTQNTESVSTFLSSRLESLFS
ncbi:MAG: very short patch repair endonuclease [Terracidiphilus sp.]